MRRSALPMALLAGLALAPGAALAQAKAPARAPLPTSAYSPGPHDDWERRAPEAVGLDPALLKEAIAFAMASETKAPRDLALNHPLSQAREPYDDPIGPFKERGSQTGIVLRHGYLAAEWGEPRRVDMTFSVTKSFVSTVVGLAVDRGLVRDLHDPVADYGLAEHFASEHNRTITWDHLLRQTSDWQGTLWGKPDWADRPEGDPSTWTTRKRNEPGRSTSTTTCG